MPFALDFGAVLAVGAAMQVDLGLLADALPAAESAIVRQIQADGRADDE